MAGYPEENPLFVAGLQSARRRRRRHGVSAEAKDSVKALCESLRGMRSLWSNPGPIVLFLEFYLYRGSEIWQLRSDNGQNLPPCTARSGGKAMLPSEHKRDERTLPGRRETGRGDAVSPSCSLSRSGVRGFAPGRSSCSRMRLPCLRFLQGACVPYASTLL